jgi:hypothetical protein
MQKRLRAFLLLILLLTACQRPPTFPSVYTHRQWSYSSLRALDPADAPQPSWDIVALYTRERNSELQIRVDLLDYSVPVDHDLYIALDFKPGSAASLPFDLDQKAGLDWDLLLYIPANGTLKIQGDPSNISTGMKLRVFRDPFLDMLEISIAGNEHFLRSASIQLQVYITPAGSKTIADTIGPVSSQNPPPPPANAILGFWHTFQSATPAQALRSWNGAHAGPLSSRYGLRHLFNALSTYHVPAFIFDLKTPANLSALDYLGVLEQVQEWTKQGILTLPDVYPLEIENASANPLPYWPPEWVINKIATDNQQIMSGYGLPRSPFYYSAMPFQYPPDNYKVLFEEFPVQTQGIYSIQFLRWGEVLVLTGNDYAQYSSFRTTGEPDFQALPTGPSLSTPGHSFGSSG